MWESSLVRDAPSTIAHRTIWYYTFWSKRSCRNAQAQLGDALRNRRTKPEGNGRVEPAVRQEKGNKTLYLHGADCARKAIVPSPDHSLQQVPVNAEVRTRKRK